MLIVPSASLAEELKYALLPQQERTPGAIKVGVVFFKAKNFLFL